MPCTYMDLVCVLFDFSVARFVSLKMLKVKLKIMRFAAESRAHFCTHIQTLARTEQCSAYPVMH